ncbi:MAG TPA: TlpA disulfide reductase family protein [Candidatus Nitrosotenuis sp.]|jgi:peroxiredoxin|nr:TlpA disulfide reductase family protein [Candidatus Nitrosotenuis sp.]
MDENRRRLMLVVLLLLSTLAMGVAVTVLSRPSPRTSPGGFPGPPPGQASVSLEQAPDFALSSLEGQIHRLADLVKEGPVVLIFYKTECPTTALSFPVFVKMHKMYGSKLPVVGVAQNDAAAASSFLQQQGATFLNLLEGAPYSTSRQYGVRQTPTVFLVARGGKVVDVVEGWNRSQLNDLVQQGARLSGQAFQPVSDASDGLPDSKAG